MSDKTVATKEEEKTTLGQLVSAKLKGASAAEVIDITQKLVRQDKSSTITERGQGNGFSQLHLNVERSTGTVRTDNLASLLRLWVKDMPAFVPQELVTALERTLEELALVELDEEWAGQKFHVSFADGRGDLIFLYLALMPSGQEGKVKFTKGKMAGKFALAPDYMVIRHSKSNFLGSKTRDEVVYIPRGITQGDVANLISNLQLPAMNYLENRVSNPTAQITQ